MKELEMINLDLNQYGPWAIVTGASSGIGEEFARQLAANGFNLLLVARRQEMLEKLGQSLSERYSIQYRTLGLDLSQADFMPNLEAASRDLDIGLVISNAGSGHPGEFLQHSMDTLQRIVRLNVLSHLAISHHFGQRLRKRGRGGIILVAAMGASQGIPYMANDAGTKAYIVSLGQSLNYEFMKHGVNVTVLMPGPTLTPVFEAFGFEADKMPMKPMSVEQCVREGLAALKSNRPSHLTGRINRILTTLIPAHITRKLLAAMIADGLANRSGANI
jgi:uncharacterized protein